jgi:hypothetical protein
MMLSSSGVLADTALPLFKSQRNNTVDRVTYDGYALAIMRTYDASTMAHNRLTEVACHAS